MRLLWYVRHNPEIKFQHISIMLLQCLPPRIVSTTSEMPFPKKIQSCLLCRLFLCTWFSHKRAIIKISKYWKLEYPSNSIPMSTASGTNIMRAGQETHAWKLCSHNLVRVRKTMHISGRTYQDDNIPKSLSNMGFSTRIPVPKIKFWPWASFISKTFLSVVMWTILFEKCKILYSWHVQNTTSYPCFEVSIDTN